MSLDIIKYPCRLCYIETSHVVLHVAKVAGSDDEHKYSWMDIYKLVQCKGCDIVSMVHEFYLDDDDKPIVSFHPPRPVRRRPDWLNEIWEHDGNLSELLDEIYESANHNNIRLLAMGIRSIMDILMTKIIGDVGGFEQKLEKMSEIGKISKEQAEMFSIVIEGGSAAAHRGYKPPWSLLDNMMTLIEFLIHQVFISGPMLLAAKQIIPPRPPRAKK